MQLFISSFTKHENTLIIDNKAIIDQVRKVLRGKIWDRISIQEEVFASNNNANNTSNTNSRNNTRYLIEITARDKKQLVGTIISQKEITQDGPYTTLCVAIPNKWNKAELITQKLTEIWIDRIIFWPAERSIIKGKNDNKLKRISTIAREASEQSLRITTPEILFLEDSTILPSYLARSDSGQGIFVFDIPNTDEQHHTHIYPHSPTVSIEKNTPAITGIIWPEWGLTEKDYHCFGDTFSITPLGESVLRMETAAIIGGWEIHKSGKGKINNK